MRHRDVRHAAFAEERAFALVRAVDELIDQDEGAGRQVFLERAACRQRDQIGDAGAFEHVDIGAVVDVGGRMPMSLAQKKSSHRCFGRDNWLCLTSAFRQLFLAATRNDMSFCHRLGQ